MKNGLTEKGIKEAANVYFKNLECYPYGIYINWKPKQHGNILFSDKKFVPLLYQNHNDRFTDMASFYDGNCEEIKKKALFNEMYRMLNNSLKLNAHEMFKEALYATRIQMKAAEQKRFFEKHISKMRLVIDENGNVSIKLAT